MIGNIDGELRYRWRCDGSQVGHRDGSCDGILL